MSKRPLCFLSYAGVGAEYMLKEIYPLLKQLQIDLWVAEDELDYSIPISEILIKGIKKSDFVVCLVNSKSIYSHFEIGAALGNNKPVLAIFDDHHDINTFANQIRLLKFDNSTKFIINLFESIRQISENVIDRNTFNIYKRKKIIGIKVGTNTSNFLEELRFTTEFIEFIQASTKKPNIQLLESGKGSLRSLVSIDLKSWAELLEKIIFFLPELKKRKADRLKIEAEILKTNAETRSLNITTDIKQAEAFIDLLEKYRKNGIKIQIDDDLLICQDEKGRLTINTPNKKLK